MALISGQAGDCSIRRRLLLPIGPCFVQHTQYIHSHTIHGRIEAFRAWLRTCVVVHAGPASSKDHWCIQLACIPTWASITSTTHYLFPPLYVGGGGHTYILRAYRSCSCGLLASPHTSSYDTLGTYSPTRPTKLHYSKRPVRVTYMYD